MPTAFHNKCKSSALMNARTSLQSSGTKKMQAEARNYNCTCTNMIPWPRLNNKTSLLSTISNSESSSTHLKPSKLVALISWVINDCSYKGDTSCKQWKCYLASVLNKGVCSLFKKKKKRHFQLRSLNAHPRNMPLKDLQQWSWLSC